MSNTLKTLIGRLDVAVRGGDFQVVEDCMLGISVDVREVHSSEGSWVITPTVWVKEMTSNRELQFELPEIPPTALILKEWKFDLAELLRRGGSVRFIKDLLRVLLVERIWQMHRGIYFDVNKNSVLCALSFPIKQCDDFVLRSPRLPLAGDETLKYFFKPRQPGPNPICSHSDYGSHGQDGLPEMIA